MRAFGFLVRADTVVGIAVSGGSDSMALMALAADFRDLCGTNFHTVTVDHGLRPEAAQEAEAVAVASHALGLPHTTLTWRRDADGPVSQENARRARHRLLAQWARQNGVGQVALGHTRDDRLETFLMRARQGSGWFGLAGLMPDGFSPVWPEGGQLPLFRPLLAFAREQLRGELRARGIAWIEDPSNDARKFERVRMRKLIARMDSGARDKALGVMDRLIRVRAAVMADARMLLPQVSERYGGRDMEIPLEARTLIGAEAWRRFVEAYVMAAGGSERPPRWRMMTTHWRLPVRLAFRRMSLRSALRFSGLA